jgi:hypothetical protein
MPCDDKANGVSWVVILAGSHITKTNPSGKVIILIYYDIAKLREKNEVTAKHL